MSGPCEVPCITLESPKIPGGHNDPQAMKGRGDGHEGELESVRIVLKRDAI